MDSFNIKSDNGDTLEDQPLKRLKCSELMDSEFDKMWMWISYLEQGMVPIAITPVFFFICYFFLFFKLQSEEK